MPQIEESIPVHLAEASEAARAWFSSAQGTDFKVTGIVDPAAAASASMERGPQELQLILCGERDGQDVCLRERFVVAAREDGYAVEHLVEADDSLASPAPLLDPPAGTRVGWLEQAMGQHAFVVLLFYRGFW